MNEKILSVQMPAGGSFSVFKNTWEGKAVFETLSIVTGLHGNQINGLHIATKLLKFLEGVQEKKEGVYRLMGKVQIFPATNVPALESASRTWSFDGIDFDLAFPGNNFGDPTEKICHAILRHTGESSCAVLLESATSHNNYLTHIRMFNPDRVIKKLAGATLLDIGRILEENEIPKTQLMRYWIEHGIPAFSIVCGRAGIYSPNNCDAIVNGLINLMRVIGVLGHREEKPKKGIMELHASGDEYQVVTDQAGFFIPEVYLGDRVEVGTILGTIRNFSGEGSLESIVAPESGCVFSLRDNPLVYEKETIAVLIGDKKTRRFWPF